MKKKKEKAAAAAAASRSSSHKIFGSKALQLGTDDAPLLVGGIVEKGFSQQPPLLLRPHSAPLPTVLPFPVARHRSHAPHWTPKRNCSSVGDDEDEDDGGDENFMEVDRVAAFANPVQRKEKKCLDFGRWRELITSDNASVPRKEGENKHFAESPKRNKGSDAAESLGNIERYTGSENDGEIQRRSHSDDARAQYVNMDNKDLATSEGVQKTEQDISSMAIDGEKSNLTNGIAEAPEDSREEMEPGSLEVSRKEMLVGTEKHYVPTSNRSSSSSLENVGYESGAMSLQRQIDAENFTRLEKMSADEIAEAQDEIMAKMNPELIKTLKKRGQEKLKPKRYPISNMAKSGEVDNLQGGKNLINASIVSESDTSHRVTPSDAKDIHRELKEDIVNETCKTSSSLWDAWSKRVEAVRELRFTLDGNVIGSDFSQVSTTGNVSVHGGYSADNVSERDFLRTEGDPGAAGYTIKEALALTRSVVPGQRTVALHLLASILDKALRNICQNPVGSTLSYANTDRFIDWEAVWAFVLGPEPELALSLRMSLDDNHSSVVLACARVIQCVLSCDINESFFDISEKIATYPKDVFTAPIFRSRPEIDDGFLQGGFWKYNTKPSNILFFHEGAGDDKAEGEHTIQDDIVVAGQDIAAGLVRMGILPRICYLLETDPSRALEESIISILIAIARHSPTCSDAIMKCPRLVQTIVNRFTIKDQMDCNISKIKSITLIKVLARSEKKNCVDFINNGTFQKMTWHLYRYALSLDHWVKLGRENCKLSSALLVEQLRFWKVCIQYGYCASYFSDLFPALCIWLSVPSFEKLTENNILSEFAAIAKETYLVVEALTARLPNFYSHMHPRNQTAELAAIDKETWCWSHVGPIVDLSLKWTTLRTDPYISKIFDWQKGTKSKSVVQDLAVDSLLWVISSIMHMLSSLLKNVIPEDTVSLHGGRVPWLPDFVPKIGLEIIKNGFFSFSGVNGAEYEKDSAGGGSFLEYLCHLRHQRENETSIASVCCLHGLVQVVVSVNELIRLANSESRTTSQSHIPRESKILSNGILEFSLPELGNVLTTFMKLISSEWHYVQSIEMFGRGGPAPGVGVGWGASGGGFWSKTILLAEMDASLLIKLFEVFQICPAKCLRTVEEIRVVVERIYSVLEVCLIVGPREKFLMDKVLNLLLQVPVLEYLDVCIRHFLGLKKFKLTAWEYKEEDYLHFSNILDSHFRNRWLSVKKKLKAERKNRLVNHKTFKEGSVALDTIHEDVETSSMNNQEHYSTSLAVEWAHQRLPFPMHWFFSSISTINYNKPADLSCTSELPNYVEDPVEFEEVAKGGIFLLLGIEAMSPFLPSEFHSSVPRVPVIWKLHSLSVILLVGMGVLEEERSRDVYGILQEVYGQLLDNSRLLETGGKYRVEFLNFQAEIHESYSTFLVTLVEQFAAVSYGDLLFGRQVAIYLHRCVESPVRLAAWNALSNAHALELLPPLEKCVGNFEGYLEPVEDNESVLEAYVKSWVSGALDRAATRGSVAYTLVLHHLSSFIFGNHTGDKLLLQNKVAKSVLGDYSRKPQHKDMMLELIRYKRQDTFQKPGQEEVWSLQRCRIEARFMLLKQACEGNSLLLSEVEKLKSQLVDNSSID